MPKLDTPTARSKLAPRSEPYWFPMARGRHLGYRAGADSWCARDYKRGRAPPKVYHALSLAAATPARDAFETAKRAAETWFATLDVGAVAHYTVDACITDYVEDRRLAKGEESAIAAEQVLNKSVLSNFKGRELASLTTAELKRWRNGLVPHRRDEDEDEDEFAERQRKAKDTANRHWATLRAALALAFKDGKVADDTQWRRVKPFEDVGRARQFYPTPEEIAKLLDKCANDFRPLVRAAVLTGFRLQALVEATVADFEAEDGTLRIDKDKKHARTATLSTAAVELFKQQAKDKTPKARLFLRADGKPWGKSHQHRPFRDACKAAKLPREFIFYSLRHYYISRALLAGMNANALAKNVGTSSKMIDKHYGKFIRSDVRDMLDRVEVA